MYLGIDGAQCDTVEEQNNYPTEFLSSLTSSGMAPRRLQLKLGAVTTLLRNLNIRQGLCNGTRLISMTTSSNPR